MHVWERIGGLPGHSIQIIQRSVSHIWRGVLHTVLSRVFPPRSAPRNPPESFFHSLLCVYSIYSCTTTTTTTTPATTNSSYLASTSTDPPPPPPPQWRITNPVSPSTTSLSSLSSLSTWACFGPLSMCLRKAASASSAPCASPSTCRRLCRWGAGS